MENVGVVPCESRSMPEFTETESSISECCFPIKRAFILFGLQMKEFCLDVAVGACGKWKFREDQAFQGGIGGDAVASLSLEK